MSKPIVAVVGRPNVGKSTMFNRLCGRRVSIVDEAPGVTRDRVYADAQWLNRSFTLIDTGGIEPENNDFIRHEMLAQARIAVETADVVLFLTDVKTGVTDADAEVANLLRRADKPVVLAVNKVDSVRRDEPAVYEFYSLGLGDPMPVSGEQALGLGDMLDALAAHFPPADEDEDGEDIKVAIVGKPNVGKSSIVNKLLGEERVIVSGIAGTTRDAVDTPYTYQGRPFTLIDTAGLRRKAKIHDDLERYSVIRAVAAVERCDVCVLVISAEEGVTEQDAKIAGIAHERGKAAVIAVNKWDAVEKDGKTINKYQKDIAGQLAYMSYAPTIFISAVTGQRLRELFALVVSAAENNARRVSTGLLNDVLIEAMAVAPPPSDKGKALKVYYMTQVSVKPPTFVLFVNDVELMHFSYKRYIENQLRKAFGFQGTPIKLIARNRKD